jgi:hypothetical protein
MNKYLDKITSIVEEHGFKRNHKFSISEIELQESYDKSIDQILSEATKATGIPANPPIEASDPSTKEGISNSTASEFFSRSRALATTTHFAHLSTDSFSEHSALATFYEEIVESVDSFCEAYIGLYGKFINLPPIAPQMQIAVDAIMEFRDWIAKNRSLITDDSSLQNLIDGTVELCNSTIYKLQKLS